MYRVVYNGSNLKVYINGVFIDDATYVAFTPQQAVLPVYSVFDETPNLFMKGNSIIKGTLGMNVYYAQGLEILVERGYMKRWGKHIYYAEEMIIVGVREEFINEIDPSKIRQIQSSIETKKPSVNYLVQSTWSLYDVYFMGGGINAAPDGNPVQRVYNFFAKDYDVTDKRISEPTILKNVVNSEEETKTINYSPGLNPGDSGAKGG